MAATPDAESVQLITLLSDNPLAGRDYLRMLDLTPEEFNLALDTAAAEKKRFYADAAAAQNDAPYRGRSVAVILEKPSLRTRVSFERAIGRLGAQPVILSDSNSAFSRGESMQDTMMVLERYVDAVVIRSFAQSRVEELAYWASVPVVNALTDDFHPCQGLADMLTIREHFGHLTGLKLAYLGDGSNNMAHTYLEAGALSGMHVTIATPPTYQPSSQYLGEAVSLAATTEAELKVTDNPEEALAGADVVITDTWTSMGSEDEHDERLGIFMPYQVTLDSMRLANPGAVFLHCLPAHRGEEVVDAVMDAEFSLIYDEAENRMHAQQALLLMLLAR